MRSILLVDNDRHGRESLAAMLRKDIDCPVLEADSPEAALAVLDSQDVSLLITDLFAPKNLGIELVQSVLRKNPEVVSVVAMPAGERETLVKILQAGALFYLNKPIDFDEAIIVAARSLEHHDLQIHKEKRGPKIRKTEGFHGIIGQSPGMQQLFAMIERVAEDGESTVLIQGESGTGKEMVAKALHAFSPRAGKNFVPLNCAAIPDDLLESELFGYVKGAFTGANQSKQGRIQYAEGGTLFLDEIGDMKPALQAKLLRVLQEKEFEPVGGVKPIKADVRIVAATHRQLEEAVKKGLFREDLYYRLSVVPLQIPPLRERREDIPLLIEKFMQVYNRGRKRGLAGFAGDALAALQNYAWPGNVRELENLVQRLAILHADGLVTAGDLPEKYRAGVDVTATTVAPLLSPAPAPVPPVAVVAAVAAVAAPPAAEAEAPAAVAPLESPADFNTLVSDFEDRLILQALSRTGGNKKEAAELLNLKRTTLLEKIKKKQLDSLLARVGYKKD
ncbi:sigma-54-dependent transcriptional regulator [Geoalkalibacter sp.]|uniref:sigma-54-dependent transcriptional regulator n=1 Tax=Geoalkalibacter sp. TaxID=3041440 RepID=UPI00272E00E6|nr:sigma-54 dependent transcriptional regulator [Geoalkalibacter sp.]